MTRITAKYQSSNLDQASTDHETKTAEAGNVSGNHQPASNAPTSVAKAQGARQVAQQSMGAQNLRQDVIKNDLQKQVEKFEAAGKGLIQQQEALVAQHTTQIQIPPGEEQPKSTPHWTAPKTCW